MVPLLVSGCPSSSSGIELPQAKAYRIVGEGNLANEKEDRTVGLWFIYSDNATGFEEYAQTAIQAARDLYHMYKRDFTSVMLIASDVVKVSYATASYAADGKGALGMTGSAPAVQWYWKVQAADRQLARQELAIAELWSQKQADFPSKDLLSSSTYDVQALRHYVADILLIHYAEVQWPQLPMKEYENHDFLND
ncbi:hypothetical protein ES703_97807 [subsurface metagenome]